MTTAGRGAWPGTGVQREGDGELARCRVKGLQGPVAVVTAKNYNPQTRTHTHTHRFAYVYRASMSQSVHRGEGSSVSCETEVWQADW